MPTRNGSRPAPARPRDLQRETAAAAEDGERRPAPLAQASSSLPSRGMQTARSPPARRKATICCTALLIGKGRGDVLDALLERALRREQMLVGAAQSVDRLAREAAALQADEIEPGERGAIAERDAERDDVVLDAREAADEGVRADAR